MQENEFEKQVKEAMEGFKLTPSAPVWNRIEQQLPHEKRRRRFIVFFLLFAGLGLGGYFTYYKLNTNVASVNNLKTISKAISDSTDHNIMRKEITAEKIPPAAEQQLLSEEQHYAKEDLQKQKKSEPPVLAFKNKQQPGVQQPFVTAKNDIGLNSYGDKDAKDAIELRKPINTEPLPQSNIKPVNENMAVMQMKHTDDVPNADSISTDIATASSMQSDSITKISFPDSLFTTASKTKKKAIKIKPTKKWQLGITAQYGRADLVENFLSLGSNFDKAYDLSTPQNGTGGGSYTEYNFNVSRQVKAKDAFTFGFTLKKQLSARSSLITGIEYANLHTQIETGVKKDTTAIFYYNNNLSNQRTELNSFYRPGYGNTYTNSYSFIQVPVVYEHQLNLSHKLQIDWNAGLSLSQMVSTNAIVFDYNNQAFYSNNKLFRKTQVDMLAGLNMQFNNGKHATINLGPQFQYNFSNLFRSGSYGKQHLINYGLRATVLFKK